MKAVFILGAALLMQIGTGRSQSPASIQEEGRDPKAAPLLPLLLPRRVAFWAKMCRYSIPALRL